MRLAWIAVVLGCAGSDDAVVSTEAFTPGCHPVAGAAADAFDAPEDFEGTVTPGTLAAWQPAGRWFFTGAAVGNFSSIHLARQDAGIVIDRDPDALAVIDDSVLFRRRARQEGSFLRIDALRVTNRAADGSLRYDSATCRGAGCTVCTARLVRAARHDPEPSDGLALVGELSLGRTSPFNVRVVADLAYLVSESGLDIVDISDLTSPVLRGSWRGAGFANDLKIVEAAGRRYAILADSPVVVLDVTDPAAPGVAALVPEEAHTLFVEARGGVTYAYFGNYDGSSAAFDVTDPTVPVRLGRYQTGGFMAHDLSVADGIAYINALDAGLQVVDFTDPANPMRLGTWASTTGASHSNWTTIIDGRRIAATGDEGFGARLDLVDVDVGSPTFMMPLGSYQTRDHVSIHNIMAFGTKAYVAYYQDGVRVVDLADPTAPRLAGYYNTWDPQAESSSGFVFEGAFGIDVDLARKLIFVADAARGLIILRDDT